MEHSRKSEAMDAAKVTNLSRSIISPSKISHTERPVIATHAQPFVSGIIAKSMPIASDGEMSFSIPLSRKTPPRMYRRPTYACFVN
jgi:hypothetical protein